MNVKSVEKKEQSAVELLVQVGAEDFDAAVEKAYRKQRGSIAIPGFRKGKAPRKIVESRYGEGMFYPDAVEELYPNAFQYAVEQENLDVVAYPSWEVQEVGKDGVTYKITVTVRPQASIKDYKGLTAEKPEHQLTEAEVEAEMEPLIKQATRLVAAERPAQMGDVTVIDFEGFLDGVPFEGGQAENHTLELGSQSFVPGFEEQVAGMTAGEEREIALTFPEDYFGAELAGKDVVFKVKLHEVKEHIKPVIDDEFVKDVSEFETLAQLRADLEQKINERAEQTCRQQFEGNLIAKLVERMEVEIPDAMVDYEADRMVEDFGARVERQGIPFDRYLEMTHSSREAMRDQFKENALRQIQARLALDAVVAAEGIVITDEEMDAEYAALASSYQMEADVIKKIVPPKEITGDLGRRKAMEIVADSATAVKPEEKEPSAEEETPAAGEAEAKTEE
ncbi:MAG: trigger factor [Clostridiales bacterium]|nr:trigger factor [Clostridiales bacterium]